MSAVDTWCAGTFVATLFGEESTMLNEFKRREMPERRAAARLVSLALGS